MSIYCQPKLKSPTAAFSTPAYLANAPSPNSTYQLDAVNLDTIAPRQLRFVAKQRKLYQREEALESNDGSVDCNKPTPK